MLGQIRKFRMIVGLFMIVGSALLSGGCAVGTTRLIISHDPLDKIENKKQGTILVKQFVDIRGEENKPYIGNKRNALGMVLGHVASQENVKLGPLLTQYFADALTEAGYNPIVQSDFEQNQPDVDAVMTGEILNFWLDLYVQVWHQVEVNVKLWDKNQKQNLWEKKIAGSKTNTLWLGINSEFEEVISQALTKALNQAAQAFASDEFFNGIKK